MKNTTPNWLMPVVAIFALQTLASFLSRLIPIVAPAMSAEFGWDGSSIGYLTAGNALGALIILVVGSGVLKRVGGTRLLQLSLFLGAVCLGLFLSPSIALALAACFIIGISTGVASPAGSEVLQRFSPPGMRNLIFSIKQAGVPLGGMVAGLAVPLIVALAGWRLALVACALMVIVPTALTWRLSATIDTRTPAQRKPGGWLPTRQSLRGLGEPLIILTQNRNLLRMAIVGSLFAVAQSAWFTFSVIFLVDRLGYSLTLAGAIFAAMQIGGILGRIVLGWLSDQWQSATGTLSMAAVFSAATTALLGFTTPDWPLWALILLAFVAGCTAASWNGVQIAEVARHSPPDRIAETSAGSAVLVSVTNIVAPAAFALFVAATGHYHLAFLGSGVCSLLVLVFLPRERR